MVLLNDVVEVAARSNRNISPARMLVRSNHNALLLRTCPSSVTLSGTRGATVASEWRPEESGDLPPELYFDLNARMTQDGYLATSNGTLEDLRKLGLTLEQAVGRRFAFKSLERTRGE